MKTDLVRQTIVAITIALGLTLLSHTDATAVGVGKTCEGIEGIKCDTGLYCDLQAGQCGVADAQGKCIRVPNSCNRMSFPVCGCDKKTYGNDCQRKEAQIQKASDGECK